MNGKRAWLGSLNISYNNFNNTRYGEPVMKLSQNRNISPENITSTSKSNNYQ